MSAVKLVTIFAENRPGQLAHVTQILAEAGVNIRWITIATSESFGVIKLLANPCEVAYQHLKAKGLTVSLNEVLAIEVDDQPGGLNAVMACLAANQVNVENASGFVIRPRQQAVLLIETRDLEQARQALVKHNRRLLTQEEVLNL